MHRNPLNAQFPCHANHGEQVVLMAVHAAGRQQAEQVQGTARRRSGQTGFAQGRIGLETAIQDVFVDPGQLLIHHAAGAEIHMPDFGVAHLPFGQADLHSAGVDQGVRTLGPHPSPVRHFGQGDGIVFACFAISPAIQNQQQHRLGAIHSSTSTKRHEAQF